MADIFTQLCAGSNAVQPSRQVIRSFGLLFFFSLSRLPFYFGVKLSK